MKEYRFNVKKEDLLYQYLESYKQDENCKTYMSCMNKILLEHQEMKEKLSNKNYLIEKIKQDLKDEYDVIWRARSYGIDRNIQILLEAMNSLLIAQNIPPTTTDKEKSVALLAGQTVVSDRLTHLRVQAMSKKNKRRNKINE
ncbi:MAG: hypothetical protein LBV67_10465 [Streptococcaceae bacterium]|jgi:hypothetical protein|nr:hypothetical protein [Streptococcaceae bacterium]